jgi:hypothetical protein
MSFISELERLKEKATKGPWWKWPDMPYLFSGDRTQKNAYMHATRVCRIDYTDADGELLQFLRNHADEIAELVKAAEKAKEMIESEYCSHLEPHGGDGCYSAFLIKALANLNKEKS